MSVLSPAIGINYVLYPESQGIMTPSITTQSFQSVLSSVALEFPEYQHPVHKNAGLSGDKQRDPDYKRDNHKQQFTHNEYSYSRSGYIG